MKASKSPAALITAIQAICILAVPAILFFTLTPAMVLYTYFQQSNRLPADATLASPMSSILYCLRDLILGGCLVSAAMETIGLLGRIRKTSAFSDKNERTLGRIAAALTIAGLLTLLFGDSLIPYLLMNLPAIAPTAERLLLPFLLLGVALMIRALQILLRHALARKEESNLSERGGTPTRKLSESPRVLFSLLIIVSVVAIGVGGYLGFTLGSLLPGMTRILPFLGIVFWAESWCEFLAMCLRLRRGESAFTAATGKNLQHISLCMAGIAAAAFLSALIGGTRDALVFHLIECVLLPGLFLGAAAAARILRTLLLRTAAAQKKQEGAA